MFRDRAALAAMLAMLAVPSLAWAADPQLEARVRELESALADLKAQMAARDAQAAPPAIVPAARPPSDPTASTATDRLELRFGGYVKLDAMATRFQRADPALGDPIRDFYSPGAIPVAGAGEGAKVDFNARQTRLWASASRRLGGHDIQARIEGDFQTLPGGGDARTTNPSTFALRRAYVSVDGWLFGQDWSTFQNVAVLPETADYLGPSEGLVFVRQAQIRRTRGPLTLALENPETTVTPAGGGARLVADDNRLPDLVVRLDGRRPWGDWSLAALGRRLSVDQGGLRDAAFGWGLSAAARVKIGGRDDIRLMLTRGRGIGRYVGLNFANDVAADGARTIRPVGVTAGFVAYRHLWSPALRSSLFYSTQVVDNPAASGLNVNRRAESLHGNLIWTPVAGFDVGIEYMKGRRALESGADGALDRVQAFARYGF